MLRNIVQAYDLWIALSRHSFPASSLESKRKVTKLYPKSIADLESALEAVKLCLESAPEAVKLCLKSALGAGKLCLEMRRDEFSLTAEGTSSIAA